MNDDDHDYEVDQAMVALSALDWRDREIKAARRLADAVEALRDAEDMAFWGPAWDNVAAALAAYRETTK